MLKIRFVGLWLSALMVLVFILQNAFGTDWFVLDVDLILQMPWTLITAMFAHANVGHLLSNLFALVLFGLILEGRIGPRRVLWLFLISGLLINLLTPLTPYQRVLGASGGIFAIIGALAMLRPWMVIYVHYLPLPMVVASFVWTVQDLFGVFFPSGTANLAHLGGLVIGLVIGYYWRKQGFEDKGQRKTRLHPHHEAQLDDYERRFGLR